MQMGVKRCWTDSGRTETTDVDSGWRRLSVSDCCVYVNNSHKRSVIAPKKHLLCELVLVYY